MKIKYITKLYKKEKGKIIFYPFRYDLNTLGIIFSICIMLFSSILVFEIKEKIEPVYIGGIVFLTLGILLSFFIMGQIHQIIIYPDERKVYKRNLLGESFLVSLDDIQDIRFTEVPSVYTKSYIYELTYKDNKYLGGICLTPKLKKKSKALKMLRETILNDVQELLVNNKSTLDQKTNNKRINLFVEERLNRYIYTPPLIERIFLISIAGLLFSLFVYAMLMERPISFLYFFLLICSIVFFVSSTYKMVIDLNNQIIKSGYLGKTDKISFSDIQQIQARYKTGMPVGNNPDPGSVKIVIIYYDHKKGRILEELVYSASKRNKKFAQFAEDLELLLGRTIKI